MPPIGETLREARMRQGFDIVDVEERTKIRAKYLRALENEEWGALPGPTFVKTFLRTYAEMVGVDPHLLVEEYRLSHEAQTEERDLQTLPGPPPAGRRELRRERRQRRVPGPPARGIVLGALALALVAFLVVLGLLNGGDDDPGSENAGTQGAQTQQEREPRRRSRRRRDRPRPPAGVTVRIAPTTPTYVCLDSGEGTDVVFEGTLEAPRAFKHAKRLRVNLGKRALEMRVNGKPVEIPQSPDPIGFDLTPTGAREIAEGSRPCA